MKIKSRSAPNIHQEAVEFMEVCDSETDLEIDVNHSVERAAQEQAAIVEQLKRVNPNTASELQEEAQAVWMSFVPDIRNITKPEVHKA